MFSPDSFLFLLRLPLFAVSWPVLTHSKKRKIFRTDRNDGDDGPGDDDGDGDDGDDGEGNDADETDEKDDDDDDDDVDDDEDDDDMMMQAMRTCEKKYGLVPYRVRGSLMLLKAALGQGPTHVGEGEATPCESGLPP